MNAVNFRSGLALSPALRATPAIAPEPTKRSKIWELHSSLHCSIIGTCLTTGELRQILGKLALAPPGATDHQLHGTAVTLASRHDQAAKLLNKALDNRHRLAISQFARLRTEADVQKSWRQAVGRGDIPGAYWATLAHPATTDGLIREAFGEVHMLSHLVGSANRADIRRLRELEMQMSDLQTRLERQQGAFRDAVVARDARIQELQRTLRERLVAAPPVEAPPDESAAVFRALVVELERRLANETRRRLAAETRAARSRELLEQERDSRIATERDNAELRCELDAVEASLSEMPDGTAPAGRRLDGLSFLYVGGRASQVEHLRAAGARLGAAFLYHDGGKEQHHDLLPGLISRADLVFFPVDCISHDAALTVKRLCRQSVKGFVPLRSSSVASYVAALRQARVMASVRRAQAGSAVNVACEFPAPRSRTDTRCALVGTAQGIGTAQDVFADDLVIQGVGERGSRTIAC
jgi:hypothetical protein